MELQELVAPVLGSVASPGGSEVGEQSDWSLGDSGGGVDCGLLAILNEGQD